MAVKDTLELEVKFTGAAAKRNIEALMKAFEKLAGETDQQGLVSRVGKQLEGLDKVIGATRLTDVTRGAADAQKQLQGLSKDVGRLQTDVEAAGGSFSGWGASMIEWNQALELGAKVYEAFATVARETVGVANEEARAQRQLAGALGRSQISFWENAEAVEAYADQLQATTRFDDDAAVSALGRIANATAALRPSFDDLTTWSTLAFDVAEQTGRGWEETADAVAKAAAGQTRGLNELLPAYRNQIQQINALPTAAERGSAAIALLSESFSGARENIDGMDQATARVSNSWENFKGSIGRVIINTLHLDDALNLVSDGLDALGNFLDWFDEPANEAAAAMARLGQASQQAAGDFTQATDEMEDATRSYMSVLEQTQDVQLRNAERATESFVNTAREAVIAAARENDRFVDGFENSAQAVDAAAEAERRLRQEVYRNVAAGREMAGELRATVDVYDFFGRRVGVVERVVDVTEALQNATVDVNGEIFTYDRALFELARNEEAVAAQTEGLATAMNAAGDSARANSAAVQDFVNIPKEVALTFGFNKNDYTQSITDRLNAEQKIRAEEQRAAEERERQVEIDIRNAERKVRVLAQIEEDRKTAADELTFTINEASDAWAEAMGALKTPTEINTEAINALAGSMTGLLSDGIMGVTDALLDGGASFGEYASNALKSFSRMIRGVGASYIAMGVPMLFPGPLFNPVSGAAYLKYGGLMLAGGTLGGAIGNAAGGVQGSASQSGGDTQQSPDRYSNRTAVAQAGRSYSNVVIIDTMVTEDPKTMRSLTKRLDTTRSLGGTGAPL